VRNDLYVIVGVFILIYSVYLLVRWQLNTSSPVGDLSRESRDLDFESNHERSSFLLRGARVLNDILWFFAGTIVSVFSLEIREAIVWAFSLIKPYIFG
jgi:hypothetical protein